MKWLFKSKDGGQESQVFGYWLFESKMFGSIVLLNFKRGSREVYHNHAFHAISWLLFGKLEEHILDGDIIKYTPSWEPIITTRDRFHRVFGMADDSWVLSIRGPWKKIWNEYFPSDNKFINLTNGRRVIE